MTDLSAVSLDHNIALNDTCDTSGSAQSGIMIMLQIFTTYWLLATFALGLPGLIYAQENTNGEKSFKALKVAQAPVIDGILDEPEWQLADVITDFHQTSPGDGSIPSEPTELYVLYTEEAIYVAARMADREPHLIAAPTIRHGQGLGSDDRLVLILDPFNTRRTGYRFETNLNAVRHDALYISQSNFQADWSTIWDVATSTYDGGWIAEMEIPFKSMSFDPGTDTWGFNFGRGIRRKGEEMAWVSYNRTYNPSIAGSVSGISGINQGLGLDIVPSLSFSQQERYDRDKSRLHYTPSVDAFYRLTPLLNAALTINTDFSATEVDNRQVNLTRFNLFFPERRDFFLQDADVFQFGNIGGYGNQSMSRGWQENARPYFSRKIGISRSGSPVDIEAGARVSGRVGNWNVGSLAIRQDEFYDIDYQNLFIGRASANVLEESNLGFIITDGDPVSNRDNTVMGVDFRYLNTRLSSGKVIEGDAWYQRSDTPGLSGNDASWGVGLRSPNNSSWRAGGGIKEVQRNFFPAMGYLQRANVRDYAADAGYTYFANGEWLQQAFSGIDAYRVEDLDEGLLSQQVDFRLLELQSNGGDTIEYKFSALREMVRAPFTIYSDLARNIIIEPGDYDFTEQSIGIETGGQRRYSGSLELGVGDFYNGERHWITGGFGWVASRRFLLSANYEINNITLPQGDFITRLATLNSQVAFSNSLYWVTLLQYDNVSEQLGVNTRLQWIPKAGQEGLVVFNYNAQDEDKDNRFKSLSADLSVKFRYTFRF